MIGDSPPSSGSACIAIKTKNVKVIRFAMNLDLDLAVENIRQSRSEEKLGEAGGQMGGPLPLLALLALSALLVSVRAQAPAIPPAPPRVPSACANINALFDAIDGIASVCSDDDEGCSMQCAAAAVPLVERCGDVIQTLLPDGSASALHDLHDSCAAAVTCSAAVVTVDATVEARSATRENAGDFSMLMLVQRVPRCSQVQVFRLPQVLANRQGRFPLSDTSWAIRILGRTAPSLTAS